MNKEANERNRGGKEGRKRKSSNFIVYMNFIYLKDRTAHFKVH